MKHTAANPTPMQRPGEEGFVLVGLIVAIFLILLVLGVAAPRVAKQLRREREVEAVHRGNQYVRAVQLYYRKTGHYPGSVDQLEKANNIRFLRQRYADPMTGKPDWRLIHVGEAKTTLKGFFGQPLAGIATTGLGSAAGTTPSNGVGTGAPGSSSFGSSSFGSSSSSGSSFGTGSGSSTGSSFSSAGSSGSFGSSGSDSSSSSGTGTGTGSTVGSSSSSSFGSGSTGLGSTLTGGGAPIMGVGSSKTGNSIIVLNEQITYPTWEFIYDPRIEQLKAKSSLLGGGMTSTNSTGLGGSSPGFSSSPGSGFGSSSGSGTSTTPSNGTSTPTTPTTTPTPQ